MRLKLFYPKGSEFTMGAYTPVIYITNRVFERIADNWLDTLAVRLTSRIDNLNKQFEEGALLELLVQQVHVDYNTPQHIRDSLSKIVRSQRPNAKCRDSDRL